MITISAEVKVDEVALQVLSLECRCDIRKSLAIALGNKQRYRTVKQN